MPRREGRVVISEMRQDLNPKSQTPVDNRAEEGVLMSQFEGQAQGYPAETGRVVYAEPLEAGSCFTDDSNPKTLNPAEPLEAGSCFTDDSKFWFRL